MRDQETYSFRKINNYIYTHGQKTVEASIADDIVKYASETVWGEARRCPGIQTTLVELMHNTYDHAGEQKGEKHWWISVEHNEQEHLELYKDGVFDYDSVQKVLDFELVRIMDTEAYVISNAILHDKLKKVSNYFEILGTNCCENCDGGSGIKPISELKSIPPYHPNCRCMVVYYIGNPEEE